MPTEPVRLTPLAAGRDLARRLALAGERPAEAARSPALGLMLRELLWPGLALRARLAPLTVREGAAARTVMLLPGFGAHPVRMRYLARRLEAAGHRVKRWGQGVNFGATPQRFARAEARLLAIHEEAAAPVHLVGWSLGGVFARELAKRNPAAVAKVVTLGSPFSGNPRGNNGWRAYQAIAGHRVDEPLWETRVAAKPPVETVALWSGRDGIVHPRCARGRPGERDRAVMLRCTHMGFVYADEAVAAVLRELDGG